MQLTASFNFYRRPGNVEVYDWLVEACTVAKNLYNQTLYYAYKFKKAYDPVREQYKKDTGKSFPWFPEYYVAKSSPKDDFFKEMCLYSYVYDKDESGNQLLHREAIAGNYLFVRELLRLNIDKLVMNTQSMTPLDLAHKVGWAKIVNLLK